MNTRNQGRVRQARKERPFRDRQRETSSESPRSANSLLRESRGDGTKNRKQRDGKAEDQSNRSRDKNYDSPGRIPIADSKDRGRSEGQRRAEKSSGYRDKNNGHVQCRDGYTSKDRRVGNFSDDSPLSVLVRQINKESDNDKRMTAAKKLEEFVNQPNNLQAVMKVVDEILSFAEAIFRERNTNVFELKDQVAKCVGIITGHLGSEAKGFIFLVISRVESASSEEHKSFLIKILRKAVEQDEKKHKFRDFIPMLLAKLHSILENADTSDLLHSVLSIIMPIAVEYPSVFTPHFRDIVDILIGWHIDTKQHDHLIQFTSDCLISLHRYWVADINFSLTLLTQFLEDMEAYSEELQCIATGQLTKGDVSPPYLSLPKLTALVRVFTTVMNGIGECFTPVKSPTITKEYITKLSKGVIDCVRAGGYSFFYEALFKAANDCFGIMCCFLKSQFSSCCEIATQFAVEQLERKSLTFVHTKSILTLIKQVIKHVNTAIPGSFVLLLLNPESAVMKLRFCADKEVLKRLLEICQSLLNIKSAGLMEKTYTVFVKDIREAYSQLQEDIKNKDSETSLTIENVEGNQSKTKDFTKENMSAEVKHYQAQMKIVFGLQVLGSLNIPQLSTNLVRKLDPPLVNFFTKELNLTDWNIACRFPAIQYTLMCSLYDHCKRNNYFLEDSTMKNNDEVEIISRVNEIILEILQYTLSSCDIRKLCLTWIVDLVELANDSGNKVAAKIDFNSLAEAMLPLSYLPEEDVRLTVSSCLRLMMQRKLLSNDTIKRSFQECVFHITDVHENVRNMFIRFLAVLPIDLASSFGRQRASHNHLNGGTCDHSLTLSITGTWLARKIHMMKPSTGTFHSHNFRVISSFILNGILPDKDEHQDWLVHLYHTCQRDGQDKLQSNPMNDKYYFSRRHDPNSVVSISTNYTLLWFWATWEMAQFSVLARLKTPLGRAQETFQAIETVLRECLNQVHPEKDKKTIRIKKKSVPQEPSKANAESSSQPPAVSQLQVKLLLQFVENLDKLMYSAYEGAAVSLPAFPKAVRLFFRTNKSTCQEWLSRIRGIITSVSIECGEATTAVRQGLQRLRELRNAGKAEEKDFELTTVAVAKAFCELKASEALEGLSTWCKKHCEQDFRWLEAMVHKSKGRYERAICEYERCLDVFQANESNEESHLNSSLSSMLLNFLVNEVTDCYTKLTDWSEVEQWQKTVQEMRSRLPNPEFQQAASVKIDMNYVRALHNFEDGEFVGVRDCLELIPGASLSFILDKIGGSPLDLGKDESKCGGNSLRPSWSLLQTLQASEVNMMQALTLYWTSGMAGGGTKKDEALRNELHELLGHGNELLEGILTNGAKDWPPSIPQIHAVQYYGMKLLSKMLSGKHEEDSSHFMAFSSNLLQTTKSYEQNTLDSSVMCKIHQITVYNHYHNKLHGKYHAETQNQLSNIQLATIHTARKEQNFSLAYKLLRLLPYVLRDQICSLSKEEKSSLVNLPSRESSAYMETLHDSLCQDLKDLENLEIDSMMQCCIYNESAKLLYALGYGAKASTLLCDSILENSSKDCGTGTIDAKSFCTLAKWISCDKKMLSGSSNGQLKLNLKKVLNQKIESDEIAKAYLEDGDTLCGELLKLSSQSAPEWDKAWFLLGGWAYKAGRKVVEQAYSGGSVEISRNEQESIIEALPREITAEEVDEILSILSKGHFTAVGVQDEEINSGTEVLTREDETVQKQLAAVSESLSEACVESLVVIWRSICNRLFSHYRTAVNAYFKYLRLHGKASVKCDVDSDRHVTTTLRLLRLLVKHAGELKTELEQGFHDTPTSPWEGIIPQLFSRLNHPEEYVRKGVTELLCRVSKDSPHLILYPAIVGCSGSNLRGDANTSGLMSLVASRSDDPDLTLEDEDITFAMSQDQNLQSGYHTIVESLVENNSELVSEVQDFVQELRRVTLLWEELWLGSLIQIRHDFEKRESQLNDEIKRVNSSSSLTNQEKAVLINGKHVALMKPIVFALEQLQSITNKQSETPHEAWFQKTYSTLIEDALYALKNPVEPSKPQTSWAKFRQLLQSLQQRSQKRSSVNLRLEEISPKLCNLNPLFIYMPGQEFSMNKVVTVSSLENDVVILPTKTRPKKIVLVGSDGQKYMYLFKGLEDLHLDERIMQFLSICNNMFAKPNRGEDNVFLARHYSVTPLGPRSGLIQWVDGAVPIFSLYKRWQQRDAAATVALTKNEQGSGFTTTPKAPLRPNELFYNKLTPLLKEKNIDVSSTNRKEWPMSIMRKVLQELLRETPQDLLEKELWCSSTCTSDWWRVSQTYSRSVAVMSIIGYILGLGDRHLDNMLIDFTTGEIVHIDYNICFEKGKGLRVPEKVPFRLTANLETALGVTGVEGMFRSSCEKVLRILRNGRETLLTLLEAFVYDPLVDWTTGNDNAFANAFYGGHALDQQEVKQSKKEMDRTITQCLFSSRVAEMRMSWRGNKDELIASLNNLKKSVNSHFSTISQSLAVLENDKELLDQMEILQSAVKSSSHPLHAVQAKYDQQAIMIKDLNSVLQTIQDRLKECQQWDIQHQAALDTVRGAKLANIASDLVKPLDVGLPSFAPAIGFLKNAGQSSTVSQCEQVETELTGLLHKRRSLLRACLDVMHTYATVISQFPSSYSHNSRSSDWQSWLQKVINTTSTEVCKAILKEYKMKHNTPVSVDDETVTLINVETRLEKIFDDQKNKFAKFYERRNQEKVETAFLNTTATEAYQKLKKFVHDNGREGRLATMNVMVTALAALHQRCLVMENTAKLAGRTLYELSSRDGDWFLEELYSMIGNVMQFVTFARTYWMDSLDTSDLMVQDVLNSVEALSSVYQMFKSLQDMMTNFRNIIVPETLKCLEINEPTVLEIIGSFQEILTSFDSSLDEMIQTVQSVLTESNDSDEISDISSAAVDMENKIMQLLSAGKTKNLSENGEDELNIQMTAGQMLLAGFNGLFTKLEAEVDSLLAAVERVDQELGDDIDVFKKVQELQVNTNKNHSILKTLYLLKRLNVMRMFFNDCLCYVKNLSDISAERQPDHVVSEDQLSVFVQGFIADFIQERMLGLPSFVLTKTVVQWLSLIGLDVSKILKEDGSTLIEELCKKIVDQNICQGLFTAAVLSKANALTGLFNTAWRKHDLARRLDLNVTLYRCVVQRAQLTLARFQWFHEDLLSVATVRGNNMITPTRATVMNDLKKRVQNLSSLDAAMSSIQEKFTQLESSIEQRLKWAAGANPSLNPTLENFERTLKDRKRLIVVESKYCSDIRGISNAILHFEAFRTKTQEAVTADQALAMLVQRCEECSAKVEKSKDSLKDVEELMMKINVSSPPGEPITLEWMKSQLSNIKNDMATNQGQKLQVDKCILESKENVRSQVAVMKSTWTAHQVLMGEVKSMLQLLAKDDEAAESLGARTFIVTHNKLNETITKMLKDILQICSSNGGRSSNELDDLKMSDQQEELLNSINSVHAIATWVFDQLPTLASPLVTDSAVDDVKDKPREGTTLTFASALRQGGQGSKDPVVKEAVTSEQVDALDPPVSSGLKEVLSPLHVISPARAATPGSIAVPSVLKKPSAMRDPRTGKALQERNVYAIGVWKRVRAKLDGRDLDPSKRMSVEDQVEHIIEEATSSDNLCLMYEGWTPWV